MAFPDHLFSGDLRAPADSKNSLPQTALALAVIASKYCRAGTINLRHRPQGAALAETVQDVTDDSPIVGPLWTRVNLRQQRLNDRPLFVVQPEVSIHLSVAQDMTGLGSTRTVR